MARPDRAWTAGAAALICTAAVGLSAHRRDEHLQAARIAIELERVDVELDITPGADVADALVSAIDGDHEASCPKRSATPMRSAPSPAWPSRSTAAGTLSISRPPPFRR